jgi:tetratricopeptide (TPR) repeat protein
MFGVRRETPGALRPLFLASAGLLAGLSLMGQSRGWLFAIGPAALAFVALSAGGRTRSTVGVGLVALSTLTIGGTLLDVRESYEDIGFADAVDDAMAALLLAAAGLAVVGAAWAVLDRRMRVSARGARVAGGAVAAAVLVTAIVGVATFSAREGSPFAALGDAWQDFKTDPTPKGEESRFSSGVGSNRYDFWRVAWAEFRDHPLAGIGVENFQQPYLERGKSSERPRHPHSLPLRALSQTGVVGALLLAAAIAAALVAALGAVRRQSGLARISASAAIAAFVYWMLHGSVDWFWELPALGGTAFALLGLACALAPRAAGVRPVRPLAATPPARIAVLCVAAFVGVALARPWLSELYVERAARGWGADREQAFEDLNRASDLNPLSATPPLVEGAIASRLGLLDRAAAAFEEALARDSGDAYAMLNLGVIEWELGRKGKAMRRIKATLRLDPRYDVAQDAQEAMRDGELLDVNEVNRRITRRASRLGR